MESQYCHGCVSAVISKRQMRGHRLYRWGGRRLPLANHRHGRLDCRNTTILWLIGARTSTDVHDRPLSSERSVDGATDARIRHSPPLITDPYGVIEHIAVCIHSE